MSRSRHQRPPKDPQARARKARGPLMYRAVEARRHTRFYWLSAKGGWSDHTMRALNDLLVKAYFAGTLTLQDTEQDNFGYSLCQVHGPPSIALRALRNQITRLVGSRPVSERAFAERHYA